MNKMDWQQNLGKLKRKQIKWLLLRTKPVLPYVARNFIILKVQQKDGQEEQKKGDRRKKKDIRTRVHEDLKQEDRRTRRQGDK